MLIPVGDLRFLNRHQCPFGTLAPVGAEKSIKKGAVISENLRVVSNLFIRAIDIESAVDLAKACPILEFGGSVEVREIPQRPVKQ